MHFRHVCQSCIGMRDFVKIAFVLGTAEEKRYGGESWSSYLLLSSHGSTIPCRGCILLQNGRMAISLPKQLLALGGLWQLFVGTIDRPPLFVPKGVAFNVCAGTLNADTYPSKCYAKRLLLFLKHRKT